MFLNLENRSTREEIMDDFLMEGDLLKKTLNQIALINKWLGGNRITINGLNQLWSAIPVNKELSIVDLGCGNGDMLRLVADTARKQNRKVKLIGIDANSFTVNYARQLSTAYPEISYMVDRIPSKQFSALSYDVVLATLFFHHFSDEVLVNCLEEIDSKATIGVVINDLHRNEWAVFLFKLLSIFIPNPMVRQDGVTSILRGFKQTELQSFVNRLGLKNSTIQWKWAFRYQWIIRTNKQRV